MAPEDPSGPRAILHVDMDAFYASVEIHDNPDLMRKPVIVGGAGARGVVASCSYEARAYGVRSAMPSSRARRLCPHAVFVAGRYDRYAEVSKQIHAVFESFTPLVEGISLDEAFLDVTGSIRLFGTAPAIAHEIRNRIGSDLGLGCSVGVAPSKFLAKLASESAKPYSTLKGVTPGKGVVVIDAGQELAFLHPLPIEALWGVGPATAERLRRLGITTVGDLAGLPTATIEGAIGRAAGSHLLRLANAIDDRPVEPDRDVKSISHEETYAVDRVDVDGLHGEAVRMSDAVAARMRKASLTGRTVTLKIRYGDFRTMTRSKTLAKGIQDGQALASIAGKLLASIELGDGIRLMGIGVSNLSPCDEEPVQMQLFAESQDERHERDEAERWRSATGAIDSIRDRFGDSAVAPAATMGPGGIRLKRAGDTQWGPRPE